MLSKGSFLINQIAIKERGEVYRRTIVFEPVLFRNDTQFSKRIVVGLKQG